MSTNFYQHYNAGQRWLEDFTQRGKMNPAFLEPSIYSSIKMKFLNPLENLVSNQGEGEELKNLEDSFYNLFHNPIALKTQRLLNRLFEDGLIEEDLKHITFASSIASAHRTPEEYKYTITPLPEDNLFQLLVNENEHSFEVSYKELRLTLIKEALSQFKTIRYQITENEIEAKTTLDYSRNIHFCIVPQENGKIFQVHIHGTDETKTMNLQNLKDLFRYL